MIDRIQKQPIEVQRITLKNLQYNALALLLENVLFSMVKFDEPEVREFFLNTIKMVESPSQGV